jgi:Fic family protein
LLDTKGGNFHYCLVDQILEKLPVIDSLANGVIGFGAQVVNSDQRDRYLISSLMEEAITSSQLEGAATTRKDAVNMLRSGRAPRDRSEQMIVNNYQAMQQIIRFKDDRITPEKLCELHRLVTENTLDNPDAAGRIQLPNEERIAVWDEQDGTVLHTPPPAQELPTRLQALCDFANTAQQEGKYLHPVVRAIILHFWLAYDHPFEDGNGRTARALFYWSMLRQGYWLFEYISISSLIKKAPATYGRAFLYTESDDNDLTYFIVHQIQIIERAIQALAYYIERKTKELNNVDRHLKNIQILNHRQKALIGHALKNPQTVYSIESHQRSHNIAYATSRADLLAMLEQGLLDQFKVGKGLRFRPAAGLEKKLRELA